MCEFDNGGWWYVSLRLCCQRNDAGFIVINEGAHGMNLWALLLYKQIVPHFSPKKSPLMRPCIPSYNLSLIPSLSRSTGSTCPAPTVPSYPPSMQSRPAKTYSGWYSPPSSPPCPTLTPAPIRMAITWPTARGCWGTTRWLGPGSSAPSETPGADARGTNRWGTWNDSVGVTGLEKDH